MKALVTGAAGFIGSHVVRALLASGHEVRALHLPSDDVRNLRGLEVERVAGDVTDEGAVERAARGCGWAFHLAAIYALWVRDPARMHEVNVEGTRRVLRSCERAGVGRVVVTGSIARFGGQGRGKRATEESPPSLLSTGDRYARSKVEAHEVAERAARAGQDVVIVAPTGPIGPGDVGPTPTGRLLLACLSLPIAVVSDTVTNFADVRDIARGHVLAAERGRRGESYLLGHRDLSLRELAAMAQAILGRRRPVWAVPPAVAMGAASLAELWAERVSGRAPPITRAAVRIARLGLAADCSKAVRELGLPQSPVGRALEDALAWFEREGLSSLGPAR